MTFTARICLRGPGYVMYVGNIPSKMVDALTQLQGVSWSHTAMSYAERCELRKRMTQPRWYGG